MNTAKHTPGPWTVSAGRVITTRSGQFYLTYGKDKHGNPLFKDFVELDNNAHLIAAAPAMYQSGTLTVDIMERVAKELERKGLEELRSLLRSAIIEQKQALAQAEGK